jgi:hypothetical protein
MAWMQPWMEQHRNLVIETLQYPEGVYRSRRDPRTRVYVRSYTGAIIGETSVETTHLRVVVRDRESLVVTAYFVVTTWRGIGEYGLRNRATI